MEKTQENPAKKPKEKPKGRAEKSPGKTAAKSKRKTLRAAFEELLALPVPPEVQERFGGLAQGVGRDLTVEQAIALAQVKNALDGNSTAAGFIRDTVGEKPGEKKAAAATAVKIALAPEVETYAD